MKELNETEISNMPDEEFKVMDIKGRTEFEKSGGISGRPSAKIKNKKN